MSKVWTLLAIALLSSFGEARADVCGSATEWVGVVGTTSTVVGAPLAGRRQITVCSSINNPVASRLQCRSGASVTFGDQYVGIQLAPGMCRTFGVPSTAAVNCAGSVAGLVAKTEECTSTSPPTTIGGGGSAQTNPLPFSPLMVTSVSASALQGATAGHAYWINVSTGALVDAGTSISAKNVTNQPPNWLDLSSVNSSQWSAFYGAQTAAAGCRLALAELWPTEPVEAIGTIPPYVRDVSGHAMAAAGLGFPIQQRLPADYDVIFDAVSVVSGALDTGSSGINTEDYDVVTASDATTGGSSQLTISEILDDGTSREGVLAAGTASQNQMINFGRGLTTGATGMAATSLTQGQPLGRRMRFQSSSPGAGYTARLVVTGMRKTPLRRVGKVAPYIQCTTWPSTASPIYLEVWGG